MKGTAAEPRLLPRAEEEDLPRMTLLEHLEELRSRIVRVLVALLAGFFICWFFREEIYGFLARPILPHIEKLAYFSVTAPFMLYVKVSLLAAVFLTSPYLVAQLWGFVAPGLYRKEKLYAVPFVFFGTVFFLAGGIFGYTVAFPYAVQFLLELGKNFEPVIDANLYFSFMMTVLVGLGLMFELPIVIFMLSQLGIVTPGFLLRHFRWAVVIIFTVAAIVTPTPDVVNLCIMAIPTVFLYLLGIGAAALAQRSKSKRLARQASA